MLITIGILLYFTSTFHSSILYNVLKVKPSPLLNTVYYLWNRSSFTVLAGWLILRYYPNGTPTRKDELKAWIRTRFRSCTGPAGKGSGLLENLVERLSRNLYGKEDGEKSKSELKVKDTPSATKRKVSSSESTSDLSDYSLLPESGDGQDRNNNSAFCFYDKRLIDLPEDKQLLLGKQSGKTNDDERTNRRPAKRPTVQIWPKLSRSIYYSHFFWLLYSCFNVNGAQPSDIVSMVRTCLSFFLLQICEQTKEV